MFGLFVDTQRVCLCCGSIIKGRVDKKFCNDYCRNFFNNQQKSRSRQKPVVRKINNVLLRNRKILEGLLQGKENAIIYRDELIRRGFDFNYITQADSDTEGKPRFCCYEYAYSVMNEKEYNIWKLPGQ